MPVQDPSLLTKADKTYLEEHLHSYRQTAHGEKEAYRLRMTRHIMTARNLRDDDKYAELCIYKVSIHAFASPPTASSHRLDGACVLAWGCRR